MGIQIGSTSDLRDNISVTGQRAIGKGNDGAVTMALLGNGYTFPDEGNTVFSNSWRGLNWSKANNVNLKAILLFTLKIHVDKEGIFKADSYEIGKPNFTFRLPANTLDHTQDCIYYNLYQDYSDNTFYQNSHEYELTFDASGCNIFGYGGQITTGYIEKNLYATGKRNGGGSTNSNFQVHYSFNQCECALDWTPATYLNFYSQDGKTAILENLYYSLDGQTAWIPGNSSSWISIDSNKEVFKGWSTSPNYTSNFLLFTDSEVVASSYQEGGTGYTRDYNFYAVIRKKAQVYFYNKLSDGTFSLLAQFSDKEEYTSYPTLASNQIPSATSKKLKGWTTNKNLTNYDDLLNAENPMFIAQDQLTTTIISSSDMDASGTYNTIKLYAVWQDRDSITIEQVLPNSQVTEPATITVTGAVASNNNTYYFDPSSNINFSIAIKQENEIYFIDSVTANTTTNLITNGNLAADRKTYTSGQITAGTNATAITITITYIEGLPIFYPSGENDSKRAMYVYWENTRAIGLYYENTRLL